MIHRYRTSLFVSVKCKTNFLDLNDFRKKKTNGLDDASVYLYNSGCNYLILILSSVVGPLGHDSLSLRKALESDQNCRRDVHYKLSRFLTL